MTYDPRAAGRVWRLMRRRRDVTARRMFGGIAFMVRGHMAAGVLNDNLVLRLGNAGAAAALRRKHVAPMDFTGKPLRSMVYVRPPGYRTDRQLRSWIERAVRFARSARP